MEFVEVPETRRLGSYMTALGEALFVRWRPRESPKDSGVAHIQKTMNEVLKLRESEPEAL